MREAAKIAKFGSVMPISGSDFVREVSQAPSDVWVVVILYKDRQLYFISFSVLCWIVVNHPFECLCLCQYNLLIVTFSFLATLTASCFCNVWRSWQENILQQSLSKSYLLIAFLIILIATSQLFWCIITAQLRQIMWDSTALVEDAPLRVCRFYPYIFGEIVAGNCTQIKLWVFYHCFYHPCRLMQ